MQQCDKKFLELYLTSTTLIGSNNKIICDNDGHILYSSKNISDKHLVGDKLELTGIPPCVDKKLKYSPLTGALLMTIYDLGKQTVIADSKRPIKNTLLTFIRKMQRKIKHNVRL